MLPFTPGINLFMAVYGLVVFLEAPAPQRKGRKRYMAASFMITIVFSFAGSLDMANAFQPFFSSTSPSHWRELVRLDYYESWRFLVTYIGVGLYIAIGDALLVRAVVDLFPVIRR
jgi:MFS family permease